MTHDEFIQNECYYCGTQRCYGVELCHKYQHLVLGKPVPDALDKMARAAKKQIVFRKALHDECENRFYVVDAKTGENRGSVVMDPYNTSNNETRELLTRALEQLYLLGYNSEFTNDSIRALITDIRNFVEETK